jgi:hypothetical protein
MIVWDLSASINWPVTDECAKSSKNDKEQDEATAVPATAFVYTTSRISWSDAEVCST